MRSDNRPGGRGTYLVSRIRGRKPERQQVGIGAPDTALTPNAGLAVITELCGRLGVIGALDAAVGSIRQRDRGFGAGELLAGIAAAQLAGEDFLTGLDRQRADAAGQQITPVPGLASTTAAGLARRPVTIDLDTTDVEVYGRKKRGVAWNHQGQRVGRPHVAAWAETEIVLAADLGDGTDDPRATAPDLLRRALGSWPAPPTTRTSASRSGPSGSRRCGGCCPASPRTPGTTRSRWTMRRSPSL